MTDIKYSRRQRGGYYVTVTMDDGARHRFIAQESVSHMRTTDYFKWTAKSIRGGASGFDRTRAGAVRDLMARLGLTA